MTTPTNIITGFLGVGKTTSILNLLANKPQNEKWAVLVNEFGEIGVDGALMSENGALIKEVPGGCMCCTAGLPMSVGINTLLRQQPDRLLIEPTGLGHPREVIATLTSGELGKYISLKATIALVDPRNLSNERYTSNQNFNDQLAVADIVIGNKVDLCHSSDIDAFNDWVTDQSPSKAFSKLVAQGDIPSELLDMPRIVSEAPAESGHHHHHHLEQPQMKLPPDQTMLRKENKGQGFVSCGWIFAPEIDFNFDELFTLFNGIQAERLKAVVNTDKGCFAFNSNSGILSVNEMSLQGFESRLEVISENPLSWDDIERNLVKAQL